MACPRTGLILRLVAGELPSAQEEEIRQHLADCLSCQSAWSDLHETWQALGEWEVVPPRDRRDAIVAAAREWKPERGEGFFQDMAGLGVFRIAASFILATGLGIAAGTAVPITRSQPGQLEQTAPSDADVAESLGIAELGSGTATGLGRGLVTGETSEQKGASS